MGNGCLATRDAHEMLAGVAVAFFDGGRNFLCLRETVTNNSVAIANNCESGKRETAAAFHDGRGTIHFDYDFIELKRRSLCVIEVFDVESQCRKR